MENLWNETEAASCSSDLDLRVYTSNLLGRSDDLVLHGGGNTSVKSVVGGEEILFVKGSGWDLVSIKAEGFAPVKLEVLKQMATLESLSDTQMVAQQKAAMIDKSAPNPSVEAILHAIIPFKFVDHTHADAVVTLSNSLGGEKLIAEIFDDFLIVPYVMPGFVLAQKIHEMTKSGFNWEKCGGIILHNHGIFTFDDDAKRAYVKMIEAVSRAEAYLDAHAPLQLDDIRSNAYPFETLAEAVSKIKGYDVVMKIDQSPLALTYASKPELETFTTRGVLTPEHIIRTKRTPLVLKEEETDEAINAYVDAYKAYFNRYATDEVMLNPAPNYAVIKDVGVVMFGKNEKEASVMADIVSHTMRAVLRADMLGGYQSIGEAESFAMEYWELEQAKLKKQG